jgi:hypothetical protein
MGSRMWPQRFCNRPVVASVYAILEKVSAAKIKFMLAKDISVANNYINSALPLNIS